MTLPRTLKSAVARGADRSRSDRQDREVNLPPLFVAVRGASLYGQKYAQARIRVRKGCYQYLVWRDGEKTREFYLGKKELRTPQDSAGAGELATSRSRSSSRRVRGTK